MKIYLVYLCVPMKDFSKYTFYEYFSESEIKIRIPSSGKGEFLYGWTLDKKLLKEFVEYRKPNLFKTDKIEISAKEYSEFLKRYDYAELTKSEILSENAVEVAMVMNTFEYDYVTDNVLLELFEPMSDYEDILPDPELFTEEIETALDMIGYVDAYEVLARGLPYDMMFRSCLFDQLQYFLKKFGNTMR